MSKCVSQRHTHTHTQASIGTLRTSLIINEILEMRAYHAGINHWSLLSRRMAPFGDKRQANVWEGWGGEEEKRGEDRKAVCGG